MMARSLRGVLLGAVILALTAGTALAQTSGSISGKLADTSGGVLPGVTVTVTGPTLQQPMIGVTQASGAYQFPVVPIGTYTVTFELTGFKKAVHPGVIVTTNFNAQIDQKMEIGDRTSEITVTATAPVVDPKKVNTGATFTKDILDNIPSARDPWQVINMTPGVQAGLNVGGSSSGQQVSLNARGTGSNVQWNLEGGSITDLSSNSSPSYYNFDSFEQIQVLTGGGDVSVQSSGLYINLTTKSGSNVFKGTMTGTFENDATQNNNVTSTLFSQSASGFLSGNPLKQISVWSAEYGGPIVKNKLWFWGSYGVQNIQVGVLNYFDPSISDYCSGLAAQQKLGTLAGTIVYADLQKIQNCLSNDKTVIKDIDWKFNYQLNASNKFQWLFTSDNKVRNARDASANTAKEATSQQTSDAPWKLPLPTHSITHTWIASDKLVFNNQFTYVGGGFFLDFQDFAACGGNSRYIPGATDPATYINVGRTSAACLWNNEQISNRTTGYASNSKFASYATTRHTMELKTDATYFVSKLLGGDHSLKFGLGYRKAPIMTFSHYGGGAQARIQCVGNNSANCGTNYVDPGTSATGLVPYQADLYRDQLLNNDWWTYNGYIQDQYSRGRLRLNGGIRYDWQQSKFAGGCVPANVLMPTLLPAECDAATSTDTKTGKNIQSFGNWGPRMSATYDLTGNGKTSIHASGSYYYETHRVLANSLSGLFSRTTMTWGPNLSSGACNPSSSGCWKDLNHDGIAQANELFGTPTSGSTSFNATTGIFSPPGNLVDPSAKIGRTREAVVGMSHELMANFAVSVDYTYRKYDRGIAGYSVGYTPNDGLNVLTNLYTGPFVYTDPITLKSANYYIVCATCVRPNQLATAPANITLTNPNYQWYNGVDITANKRFSNRWQMNVALTVQANPSHNAFPSSPTGLEYTQDRNGSSNFARYLFKANGSYQMPWGITMSANLNINDGNVRGEVINGPGSVPNSGGLTYTGAPASNLSFGTLVFQPADTVRLKPSKLLDLGAQKVFNFRGGKNRVTLMLDAFNIFNTATIQGYSTGNLSLIPANTSITSIVPPRVFRIGARISF